MEIYTPNYYDKFKCIAQKCTDTCCAGWDVDVDETATKVYESVKGTFGKRLESVMVPDGQGGCTFTLKDGRCPFLNDNNLCDLYTAMGEDNLCETCADFPRFTNDFGERHEVGIAPSCITAGELMFSDEGRSPHLVLADKPLNKTAGCSDRESALDDTIDFEEITYKELLKARDTAWEIVENPEYTINQRVLMYMKLCDYIQYCLDMEEDENINATIDLKEFINEDKNEFNLSKVITEFFDEFPEMEVINKDWNIYAEKVRGHLRKSDDEIIRDYKEFDCYYKDSQEQYSQLLFYYIFRYFLSAVYDYNIMLKAKYAVVGYICLKEMDVALFAENKSVTYEEHVDMAHLYSRQFEHSYVNFEKYSEFFQIKPCYSLNSLKEVIKLTL